MPYQPPSASRGFKKKHKGLKRVPSEGKFTIQSNPSFGSNILKPVFVNEQSISTHLKNGKTSVNISIFP